jgi:hypothetical protein
MAETPSMPKELQGVWCLPAYDQSPFMTRQKKSGCPSNRASTVTITAKGYSLENQMSYKVVNVVVQRPHSYEVEFSCAGIGKTNKDVQYTDVQTLTRIDDRLRVERQY